MQKRKIISTILCFSIIFSVVFFKDVPKAQAIWPTTAAIANLIPEALTTGGTWADLGESIAKYAEENYQKITIAASKMAALWAVQQLTMKIISKGDPGSGGTIADWNIYLYIKPQQRAMAQMNSFFTTVSRGRLSAINYEGVGPNYDAYLVRQAQQSITGQPFQTNLQDQVTDPSQLFSGGNMKGIMSYMQCANNVACYTLTSTAQYNAEFAKAQDIAKNEQHSGFLPAKKNGVIIRPAALLAGAFNQLDQLGTEVIMSADAKDGIPAAEIQIAKGVAMNVAARTLNYATSDDAGKRALQNANDQPPFSVGYSNLGGLGFAAGGITSNSGLTATSVLSSCRDLNNNGAPKYNTPTCCVANGGKWEANSCKIPKQ